MIWVKTRNRPTHRVSRAADSHGVAPSTTLLSDTDALRELLTVIGRVTEEKLGALGTLEVQVCRVFPSEADSTLR